MAVPFFFMASGYLLASKMEGDYGAKDLYRIEHQLYKTVKMYLFWTLVYLPLAVYHFISTSTPLPKAILLYGRGLLLWGEQYNSWHLWYLLSTIYTLIILYVLMKRNDNPKAIAVLCAVSSVVSVGLTFIVNDEGVLYPWAEGIRTLTKGSIGNGRILSGLVYIPIGMLIFRKRLPVYINWIMLIVGGVIHVFVDHGFLSGYLTILSSVGLFGLIERCSLRNNPIYEKLRAMSTTIYLIHLYIWSIYYKVVYGEKTYGLDCFLVTSFMAFLISFAHYRYTRSRKTP